MTEPVTIIHIIPFLHFGAGRHVANLIAALDRLGGFEQYLATAGAADDLSDDPALLDEISPRINGRITATVFKRDIPALAAAMSDLAVLVSASDTKRVVLHANTGMSSLCAAGATGLLGSSKDVRVAVTLMGGSPEKPEPYKQMDAWAASHASIALPISEAVKTLMTREGVPPHIQRVLYSGLDLPAIKNAAATREQGRAQLGLNPADEVIGTVSQLSPRKGVDYLLRAFKIVAQKRQHAKLLLVGRGHPEVDIKNTSAALGIADRVITTGEIAGQYTAMRAMDVFAMTSLYEGLGLALVEAQTLGIPVVCFDTGGMPETLIHGKTGFTVPMGDEIKLAEKIMMLLEDKDLNAKMSAEGPAWVRTRFDINNTARELAAIYAGIF